MMWRHDTVQDVANPKPRASSVQSDVSNDMILAFGQDSASPLRAPQRLYP